MEFLDALRQEDMVTENGMATNSTSLNACVDLFFNIGAMRGQDKKLEIGPKFNPVLCVCRSL